MSNRIEQKQIDEWTENPVTLYIKELIASELKSTRESMADAYYPFEPQRTQEVLAGINGAEDTWELVATMFSGDLSYWEPVEEDDEQIGD